MSEQYTLEKAACSFTLNNLKKALSFDVWECDIFVDHVLGTQAIFFETWMSLE